MPPANLPRLIEMVAGQEQVCIGRLQDLKRLTRGRSGASREWAALMRMLATEAEVAFWNSRIEWLQSARELLEQLRDEQSRPMPETP